jgi:hypothetical protein
MAETTQPASMSQSRSAGDTMLSPERMLDDAKDLGSEIIAAVRDNAIALFDEQRNRAANEIAAVGEVLHNSAQSLDQRGGGIAARCAGEAATQIDDVANWLRGRSWAELTGDIGGFARRYPMAFIGTAAALGFLACRVITASPANPDGASSTGSMSASGTGERAGGGISAETRTVSSAVLGGAMTGHGAGGEHR